MNWLQRYIFAATVACAGIAHARDIAYLGLDAHSHAPAMRDATGTHVLHRGDTFANLGQLRDADEYEAVFERVLGDEERDALKAKGFFAPNIERRRIVVSPGAAATPLTALGGPG
jgi:hypothetical protein